ncbi:twin-arginine translocase TatA/TatE family subunit [Pontiellaceae bacterium B12219]|nr:twin-arginine translocase TatA/TatE family subunit [Pontiellaceae bacterium B12219]
MTTIAFAGLPGGSEVLLILFIILLLFGAKKLPELSRSLGRSLGEFKKGKEDLEREIRDVESDFKKASKAEIQEKKDAETPAEPKASSEPAEPDRS